MIRTICVFYALVLMSSHACSVSATPSGQEPLIASDEKNSATSSVDLTNPLDALAGELLAGREYSHADFARAKERILTKARKVFAEKRLPVLLKQHDVANTIELNNRLLAHGHSLAEAQNTFVWKLLIAELKRTGDQREQ